jgi:hypothetical protein
LTEVSGWLDATGELGMRLVFLREQIMRRNIQETIRPSS